MADIRWFFACNLPRDKPIQYIEIERNDQLSAAILCADQYEGITNIKIKGTKFECEIVGVKREYEESKYTRYVRTVSKRAKQTFRRKKNGSRSRSNQKDVAEKGRREKE